MCDPWLLGSCYWRSWWNFPPQDNFYEILERWKNQDDLFIYITHLHWDHFHGPTIKSIIKKAPFCKFIIPKTPERRIYTDLKSIIGKSRIIEIPHSKKFKISQQISICSFQSGPFFADSALSIFSSDFCILNLNDSKLLPLSNSHLLSLIPKPDYVLRSHSSANSRCCYRDLMGNQYINKADKSSFEYSLEFFDACYGLNTKFAIPFASNMAHLHKDTFEYNSILNFADYVVNDFEKVSQNYKGMKCKMILPSEKINLISNEHFKNVSLRSNLSSIDRNDYFTDYQLKVKNILDKQYKIEEKSNINEKNLYRYFNKIINSTNIFIRMYLKDKIIFEIISLSGAKKYCLDFKLGFVRKIETIPKDKNIVKVVVNSFVINDVCAKFHYNSLGVSKRLKIFIKQGNLRYFVFNSLCNTVESGGFLPFNKIFRTRFLLIWLSRYREIIDLFIFLLKSKLFKRQIFMFSTNKK